MHKTLDQWLLELEKIHPLAMDFKLERIQSVLQRLAITPIAPFVITVAGTNGKGSTTNTMAAICQASNVSVGLYTSPHLHSFNERIQINGAIVNDEDLIEAFEAIQIARANITLTYFEYATLAAFYLFYKYKVALAILEVGLGGRLDATNIVDADIAIITPIDIDHTAQLGNTITEIAFEKAGIIKPNALTISAENSPNTSIIQQAQLNNSPLLHAGKNFSYHANNDKTWHYQYGECEFTLPLPRLQGAHQLQNAATAITALLSSPIKGMITTQTVAQGLLNTQLKGRFEKIQLDHIEFYFDVTHNPQGAMILHELLQPYRMHNRKIIAVLGMLKDKDAIKLASALKDDIDHWILAALEGERGQTAHELKARISPILTTLRIETELSVADACQKAISIQQNDDIILVFGSFHTVNEGLNWISQRRNYE